MLNVNGTHWLELASNQDAVPGKTHPSRKRCP